MKVRDVMTTSVVSAVPSTPYDKAAELMHQKGIGAMPVLEGDTLVGVISEKDLFRAMYPDYGEYALLPESFTDQEAFESKISDVSKHPISEFMSKKLVTIDPDAAILKAGGIMLAHHVHHLPVIEHDKLVGIVAREDIFSAILKHELGF